MDVSHLLENLNEPQRNVVAAPLGHQLVLAGAGSGKTRVLVHRIAYLLAVENLSLFSVMAVTFTNKAAGEMRSRLASMLQCSVTGMWVGTFHNIAHRLLRRHYEKAQLPQHFQILDSDDQLRMIKRVLRAMNLDEDKWPAKQMQWFINGKKDDGLRPKHVNDNDDPHLMTCLKVYEAYEIACTRAGVIDFAEILLRAHEMLLHHTDILQHYQKRFTVLLVDEFQDTNTIQYAFIKLLAQAGTPVMVVGDDDQSIYGWRGAKIENIQRFEHDFKNVSITRLEQNYRSTATILQAANQLISHNAKRMGKSLWTAGVKGDPIMVYAAFNEVDEARFVVERIALLLDKGRLAKEIAVLYRSNAQSRVIEETLIRAGIAYRIYGGLRFFDRAEIKDVLAYLRLIGSYDDDAAFERVVNLPTRGIGERTLSELRTLARLENKSLWQAALLLIAKDSLTARATKALQHFIDLILRLEKETVGVDLHEQVEHVITHSGLHAHHSRSRDGKAQSRVENMQELVNAAKQFRHEEFEEETDMPILSAFVTHAALEAGETQALNTQDYVQLMTMHSAKGLEFPFVFITGVEEGVFPSHQSVNEVGRLEEERRLCYVGMTRAQEVLTLSYAEIRRQYGREEYHRPSRFLRELPAELLAEIRVQNTPPVVAKKTPSRAYIAQEDKSHSGLKLGQRVCHAKFGEGIILNFEGTGAHARCEVKFNKVGSKWLVIAYANLKSKEECCA